MSGSAWEWISASATGTSHIQSSRGCDDSGACIPVESDNETALIAVCSDGAGSAKKSSIGSRIVTRAFCRNAKKYLQDGGTLSNLSPEIVNDWLDDIRGRISSVANQLGLVPRDFAATLVGCIVTDQAARIIHVGDGAVVYRTIASNDWIVGSWPSHGEYASTTYFVTDDPQPFSETKNIEGSVVELAVFTDGIEHLVLDFATKSAFPPFFNQMFYSFKSTVPGKNRKLSQHLTNYLKSSAVCDRTDDDKTLLLARRISCRA